MAIKFVKNSKISISYSWLDSARPGSSFVWLGQAEFFLARGSARLESGQLNLARANEKPSSFHPYFGLWLEIRCKIKLSLILHRISSKQNFANFLKCFEHIVLLCLFLMEVQFNPIIGKHCFIRFHLSNRCRLSISRINLKSWCVQVNSVTVNKFLKNETSAKGCGHIHTLLTLIVKKFSF